MSDTVEIVKLALAFLTATFTAWVGYLVVKLNMKAAVAAVEVKAVAAEVQNAAVKAEQVKDSLENSQAGQSELLNAVIGQVTESARVGIVTHTLVNSQHGIALATVYSQAQRIATLTGDPEDIRKATDARLRLDDHELKQGVVDRRIEAEAEAERKR